MSTIRGAAAPAAKPDKSAATKQPDQPYMDDPVYATSFSSVPVGKTSQDDIMFQLGSTPSNGSFQQSAAPPMNRGQTLSTTNTVVTTLNTNSVAYVAPPVVATEEQSKAAAYEQMDLITEQMYKQRHPTYTMWSNNYSDMTQNEENLYKSVLISQGFRPDWVTSFISEKFQDTAGPWVYVYDPYEFDMSDPTSQRAYDEALKMWRKSAGTVYYESYEQLTIPYTGQPSTFDDIAFALQKQGFDAEICNPATGEAQKTYNTEQQKTIQQGTEAAIAEGERQNALRSQRIDNCVQMLREGATPEELDDYLIREGETDAEARNNIIDNAIGIFKTEQSYIDDRNDQLYGEPTIGDKIAEGVGDVFGFIGDVGKEAAEGVGGIFDSVLGGVVSGLGIGNILLIVGVGIVALVVFLKVV